MIDLLLASDNAVARIISLRATGGLPSSNRPIYDCCPHCLEISGQRFLPMGLQILIAPLRRIELLPENLSGSLS
ncbi:MAG: hypothetical protein P4L44_08480 [Oryzomonas sp.]|uniref:hypothetical protein n=1 Tax=Oryzomonas sp. TaxID=2855186 RepID=UPI00283B24AD|nr:hypothetical protein [Oryzomonas sp.]MDR3579982.1 hypothetical protein [Oryzomonas sp.]